MGNYWDVAITIGILVSIGLAFWAKISNQTITELLREIKDLLTERDDPEDYIPAYQY